MTSRLLFPEALPSHLRSIYQRQRKSWLLDNECWPLSINLGSPTEADALREPNLVQNWISSWQTWASDLEIDWQTRKWKQLGTQSIPHRLILPNAHSISSIIGETETWNIARIRFKTLVNRWPNTAKLALDSLETLERFSQADFERMLEVIDWLLSNPASGLYPRQIPFEGIDSKWFESRRATIQKLVESARDLQNPVLTSGLGLRDLPTLIRIRILDENLRRDVAGLGDISSPIEGLLQLRIHPRNVLIVENLQTFLALNDLPSVVAVFGMGYQVPLILEQPWLKSAQCFYWGDIDTHGLKILNMAKVVPGLRSIMMDHDTLLTHQELWSEEKKQSTADADQELLNLSDEERSLYRDLKNQTWGTNVRLEQERISWSRAQGVLEEYLK